jgi:hypothetical protein
MCWGVFVPVVNRVQTVSGIYTECWYLKVLSWFDSEKCVIVVDNFIQ